MASELKEPGQRAYEAYHRVMLHERWWHAEGSLDREAWAAVEQALSVPEPAASEREGKAQLIRDRLERMSPEAKLKAVEALAVFANEGAELVEKQLEVYDSIAAAVMRHDDDDVEVFHIVTARHWVRRAELLESRQPRKFTKTRKR